MYGGGSVKSGTIISEPTRRASAAVGHGDPTGHRCRATARATQQFRSKKTYALLSYGIRCAPPARDGQPSPRMDSVDGQLRHKQPRQLCLCRHAAAGPRLSPASEPHVCLLGRRSDGFRRLAACCVPVALVGGRRGHAAALLVTRVGRAGVCCCYSLLATAHTVRVGTCGTLARPSGRRVHAFVCGCAHVNRPTPVFPLTGSAASRTGIYGGGPKGP